MAFRLTTLEDRHARRAATLTGTTDRNGRPLVDAILKNQPTEAPTTRCRPKQSELRHRNLWSDDTALSLFGRTHTFSASRNRGSSPREPRVSARRSLTPQAQRSSSITPAKGHTATPHATTHTKGMIFPRDEVGVPRDTNRLYSSNPFSDGSHLVQRKRVASTPPPQRPQRPGKHINTPHGNLEGSGIAVTGAEYHGDHRTKIKLLTPKTDDAPFRQRYDTVDEKATMDVDKRLHTGLLGYGATGRKHIDLSSGENPLEHRDGGWGRSDNEIKRGVHLLPSRHVDHNPLVLEQFTPEQLNEKKFKPSCVVMRGPAAFEAPRMVARTLSPSRKAHTPADNNVISHSPHTFIMRSQTPIQAAAGQPAAAKRSDSPVRTGRGVGQYSPLRERPF